MQKKFKFIRFDFEVSIDHMFEVYNILRLIICLKYIYNIFLILIIRNMTSILCMFHTFR
jgi:hypothetical protein